MKRHLVDHFDHWDSGEFPSHVCYESKEKPNYYTSKVPYFCLVTAAKDKNWAELAVCYPGRALDNGGNEQLYWSAVWTDEHERTDRRTFWRHKGFGADREVVAWIPVNDPVLTPDEMSRELDRFHHEVLRLQATIRKLEDEIVELHRSS